jgi:hypothetical protein
MTVKKKIIMQGHHPDREAMPDYTISLRKWIHLYLRRLEQFGATESNIKELENVYEAVGWVLFLKKAKMIQGIDKEIIDKEAKNISKKEYFFETNKSEKRKEKKNDKSAIKSGS